MRHQVDQLSQLPQPIVWMKNSYSDQYFQTVLQDGTQATFCNCVTIDPEEPKNQFWIASVIWELNVQDQLHTAIDTAYDCVGDIYDIPRA